MSHRLNLSHIFFLLCLGFLFYLTWIMAKPFVGAIIFAGILVGAFYPLHKLMMNKWSLSTKISSLITCFVIFVVVILPLIYVGFQISREVINFYQDVSQGLSQQAVKDFFYGDGRFASFFREVISMAGLSPEKAEESILEIVQMVSSYSIGFLNSWLGNLLALFFKFAVMIVAAYGLLNWGDELRSYIFKLSPLPDDQEELILEKFNQMNSVTLIGNGVGGVIQGGLAGIAFAFCGFQSVFMWSVIMVILAFIPVVGISIIYIPASIYLFITGHIASGVSLFVFCSAVAFVTENWFKPKYMGDKVKINSILVLLFIIGGMSAWGMAGIFYGPVICVVFMTMVEIYHQKYAQDFIFHKEIS